MQLSGETIKTLQGRGVYRADFDGTKTDKGMPCFLYRLYMRLSDSESAVTEVLMPMPLLKIQSNPQSYLLRKFGIYIKGLECLQKKYTDQVEGPAA